MDAMPGGRGLRHYNSLLLRLRREGWIEEDGRRVGFNMRIICRKNKVGTPFGECILPFRFRGELDFLSLLADRAMEAGLIEVKGPWYYIRLGGVEPKPILGKNSLVGAIRDDGALRKQLEEALGD
jgi:hypothetical protein